ncbi:hypothetical protein ACFVZQ_09000, partial [Streptomyces sp. NPDC059538]
MMSTGGLITRATALLTGDGTPPVTTPRDPAREAAERELSKPMYHENDPSLMDRALRKFFGWLDDMLGAAPRGAPPGGGGAPTLIWQRQHGGGAPGGGPNSGI